MSIANTLLHLGKRALRRGGNTLTAAAEKIPTEKLASGPEKRLLQKNASLRDKHKGQRCFVIATGPSLGSQDLTPLAEEITFVMSGFWKHPVVQLWQPTYYCISDPLYFDGSEPMRNFFASLSSRIHDSVFFLPLAGRDIVRGQNLLPEERICWVGFDGELGHGQLKDIDLSRFIPSAMTVSQLCLMAAIYMGCSPIYLLGMDHDWLSHREEHRHFYLGHGGLENHPSVRPELQDHSYKTVMECALIIWNGYEALLQLAQKKGIEIFNATDGGFLDVFERVDYRHVVSNHSKTTSAAGEA